MLFNPALEEDLRHMFVNDLKAVALFVRALKPSSMLGGIKVRLILLFFILRAHHVFMFVIVHGRILYTRQCLVCVNTRISTSI